jgi:hypothetical protein
MNWMALKPCEEGKIVLICAVNDGPVACGRCRGRDTGSGHKAALLIERGHLNVGKERHGNWLGDGLGNGQRQRRLIFEMDVLVGAGLAKYCGVRGRDKLLGIDCTQIPIDWSCHRGIYMELQFLRIATLGIAIPENCGLLGNKNVISKE